LLKEFSHKCSYIYIYVCVCVLVCIGRILFDKITIMYCCCHNQGCRIFQSLHYRKVVQDVQERFCANSNSKKSDPKIPSGRPTVSRRHGNTSEHTSEFKKILAFLRRHGVGRQLAPVRTLGQYRRDAEILDKEIACIHCISQDDRATPFERGPVMAITCR